jgi:hypothetical protein
VLEAHGGSISAENKPEGPCFVLTIPAKANK